MQIFKKWEMVKFLDAMRLSNSVADLKLMIWFLTRIWEYLSLSQDCSVSMILIKVSASLENSSSLRKFQSKRSGLILALDGRKCM